jgi:hypothetical protein
MVADSGPDLIHVLLPSWDPTSTAPPLHRGVSPIKNSLYRGTSLIRNSVPLGPYMTTLFIRKRPPP